MKKKKTIKDELTFKFLKKLTDVCHQPFETNQITSLMIDEIRNEISAQEFQEALMKRIVEVFGIKVEKVGTCVFGLDKTIKQLLKEDKRTNKKELSDYRKIKVLGLENKNV